MYLSLHFDSHEMKLVHENISLVNNVKKVIFDLENDSAHWFHKCFLLIFPKTTITSSGGNVTNADYKIGFCSDEK